MRAFWAAIETQFEKADRRADGRKKRLIKAIPRLLDNAATESRVKYLDDEYRDMVVHNLKNQNCAEKNLVEPVKECWSILQQLIIKQIDRGTAFTRDELRAHSA